MIDIATRRAGRAPPDDKRSLARRVLRGLRYFSRKCGKARAWKVHPRPSPSVGAPSMLLGAPTKARGRKMSEIWLATGEATVLAADGQYTDAMPEVMIGNVKGPVGHAFASMAGQVAGHPRMFVIRDLNQQVRPATMMTTKMTVKSEAYVELLGGVVQAATGDAIIDCVAEGILPKAGLSELCMVIMVWLDPRCASDENLDRKDLYRTNYEATKLAISRAIKGEPTIDELIKNRKSVSHYALEGVFEV
jgi:formaldehyde-activating enzyme